MKTLPLTFGAFVETAPVREDGKNRYTARARAMDASGTGTSEWDALMALANYYRFVAGDLETLARNAALEHERATGGVLFNGFDDKGIAQWVGSDAWMRERDHEGRTYNRTGKIGRLRVLDRKLGTGAIGEPVAEYEDDRADRMLVNLDGEIVGVHA